MDHIMTWLMGVGLTAEHHSRNTGSRQIIKLWSKRFIPWLSNRPIILVKLLISKELCCNKRKPQFDYNCHVLNDGTFRWSLNIIIGLWPFFQVSCWPGFWKDPCTLFKLPRRDILFSARRFCGVCVFLLFSILYYEMTNIFHRGWWTQRTKILKNQPLPFGLCFEVWLTIQVTEKSKL